MGAIASNVQYTLFRLQFVLAVSSPSGRSNWWSSIYLVLSRIQTLPLSSGSRRLGIRMSAVLPMAACARLYKFSFKAASGKTGSRSDSNQRAFQVQGECGIQPLVKESRQSLKPMDVRKILNELYAGKRALDRAIAALEEVEPGTDLNQPAHPVMRRGRKSMETAERREVSARMKRYWETRRKSQLTDTH